MFLRKYFEMKPKSRYRKRNCFLD